MDPGALLAVEMRSGHPEVAHLGHAVLVAPDGSVLQAWGDPRHPAFWRSTAKPLQAVPFSRVLDRFRLGPAHLAVACGSHTGEGQHVEAARAILEAIGRDESDLLCGIHAPWGKASAFTADDARPLHNNCSGNHAGLLAVCVAEGWDLAGYFEPGHPVQALLARLAAEASGGPVALGVDGCGLPTFRTPLVGLARAYQWLLREAPSVLDAMATHPVLVGGTQEFDTDLITCTRGEVVGKFGALGVHAAVHRPSGTALAVRITTANETVCDAVAGRILAQAGLLGRKAEEALRPHLDLPVLNGLGQVVGKTEFRLDAAERDGW